MDTNRPCENAAMLVDSHCHLDFPDFQGDVEGLVSRAKAAGVGHMLSISTHVSRFDQVLAMAERYENVFCTIGIHPHEAGREEVTKERLIALAAHPKVVGFGETGLDYFYEHSPRDRQRESFRVHIAAARESGLPVIVHAREADQDIVAILEDEQKKGAFKGLIHCFSSSRLLAESALGMGFCVSLSGIVTFKGAKELRKIVQDIPLDRLLVETDAPFLAPVPKRGKRNEPAFVRHTAACVAEIKEIDSLDEFARLTTDNFFRLFEKAKPCG
jgi:TatD DNase family protein